MWKKPVLCVLLSALLASYAFAQIPKNPRAPTIPVELKLGEVNLFGGAIEAVVEVAKVDTLTPPLLNGTTSNDLADMHFEVQLRAAKDNVLGARAAGEFIPNQRVHVRIENRSTPGSDVLDFDLAPHVGREEGWHYASNVALPPLSATGNPFNDDYLVTVTLFTDNALAIHSDATPPSAAFRGTEGIVIFNQVTKLGPQTTTGMEGEQPPPIVVAELPAGNVDKQLALAEQFKAMVSTAKGTPPDFIMASTLYRADTGFGETLESAFQNWENPERYAPGRGLTAEVLETAEDHVSTALDRQPIVNDCNVGGIPIDAECGQWVDKGGQRMFYLNLLHEVDEAVKKVADGNFNAVDGAAHNWDEAWAFWQALKGTAQGREANCAAGEFGSPGAIDCALVADIEAALLAGSNAILANAGEGLSEQIALLEERLNQVLYLSVFHELVGMRVKNADEAGFNVARVEGIAFFSAIAYLVPGFDASALEDRDPANFTQAAAQGFMQRLKTAFTGIVRTDGLGDPTALP